MMTRTLGAKGPATSAIGLGCMGMSDLYGPWDHVESLATINAALDAGVTLLDTGDFYGMGHNEMLIAEALKSRPRDDVILSVKFGAQRDPVGNWIGVDYVDIYRPARLDPNVPIEDTIGAIADMVKAGYVRFIGLSEVGSATLRRAAAVHPIADLQIEYSLLSRGIESSILPTCRALGIGVTAYGVLARGLISGRWTARKPSAQGDFRATIPRFHGANLGKNLALVTKIKAIADARGVAVAHVAIAWVLSRGTDIVPVIGARRREQLAESLGATAVALGADDLAALEILARSVAGARYAEAQMAHLDSELG
jgi:aryl-alcohol dehydrogenase-like predicted oxidoreductase